MTAHVFRNDPKQNVATSQTTEFRCLYTHDLRRKQKRWQDGSMRFHEFNRRIMVYDTSGNYIGDVHWKENDSPGEGEELTLERGVIVQVGDVLNTTQSDISGLFQKRTGEPCDEPREDSQSRRPPLAVTRTSQNIQTPQTKHKSLSQLLGKRQGPIGKAALPTKSPYDMRREAAEQLKEASQRAPKRQKLGGKEDIAKKILPGWARPADANIPAARGSNSTTRIPNGEIVNLTSSLEELHSDVTLPPTPRKAPAIDARRLKPRSPVRARNDSFDSHDDQDKPPARSNLNAAESREENPEGHVDKTDGPQDNLPKSPKPVTKSTKPLRIVKAPPRQMLMCASRESSTVEKAVQMSRSQSTRPATQNRPKPQSTAKQANTRKRKSLLDPDGEITAFENGEGLTQSFPAPEELRTGTATSRSRRARSVSVEAQPIQVPEDDTDAPQTRPTRRSPFKKSLTTTDAGNSVVSKKSKASKTATNTTARLRAVEVVGPETVLGPWSIEAFDLFDWRPPGYGADGKRVAEVVA